MTEIMSALKHYFKLGHKATEAVCIMQEVEGDTI